jgi:hypothetical protein
MKLRCRGLLAGRARASLPGDRRVERFDNFIEYEQLYGRPAAAETLACDDSVAPAQRRIADRRTQLDRLRDLVEERASLAA